jgi:hypothetical protein
MVGLAAQLPARHRHGRLLPPRRLARVVLVAGDGPWSEGFDQPDDLGAVPAHWSGVVCTNRVGVVAPLIRP